MPKSLLFLFLAASPALASPSLDGVWRQDCQRSYQREERISGSHATFVETNFRDRSCTHPSVKVESRGLLFLGRNVIFPIGASELDFLFVGVRLTPLDAEAAAFYESIQLCGLKGWNTGEAKEIGSLLCDFFGQKITFGVPAPGTRKFGVVRALAEELYFGRLSPERDGSTPERRPLELDPSPYRRVP